MRIVQQFGVCKEKQDSLHCILKYRNLFQEYVVFNLRYYLFLLEVLYYSYYVFHKVSRLTPFKIISHRVYLSLKNVI